MEQPLILITGGTGHLGFRTLVLALEAGYRVRAAVRTLDKAQKIREAKSIVPHLERLECVEVPDITIAEAYVNAVKGVDFAIHIASPIHSPLSDDDHDWSKLLYEPAVQGTLSMLKAAAQEPRMQRVVITSSTAVLSKTKGGRVGPNELSPVPDAEALREMPTKAQAYRASKLLSHVAAGDFVRENNVHFDLVFITPGYLQGANELLTTPEDMIDPKLAGSNEGTIRTMLGISTGSPRPTSQTLLDDVARAHVLALKAEVAKDGDVLLVAGNGGTDTPWSEWVPLIERMYPRAVAAGVLRPRATDECVLFEYDVTASERALGFKFAGPEEMIRSVVDQYLKLVGFEEKA